jgi:hypothetical protein
MSYPGHNAPRKFARQTPREQETVEGNPHPLKQNWRILIMKD